MEGGEILLSVFLGPSISQPSFSPSHTDSVKMCDGENKVILKRIGF